MSANREVGSASLSSLSDSDETYLVNSWSDAHDSQDANGDAHDSQDAHGNLRWWGGISLFLILMIVLLWRSVLRRSWSCDDLNKEEEEKTETKIADALGKQRKERQEENLTMQRELQKNHVTIEKSIKNCRKDLLKSLAQNGENTSPETNNNEEEKNLKGKKEKNLKDKNKKATFSWDKERKICISTAVALFTCLPILKGYAGSSLGNVGSSMVNVLFWIGVLAFMFALFHSCRAFRDENCCMSVICPCV